LPGKPDLVFPGRKKVIFVHGCFWHGHDCPAGRKIPKTNQEYWLKKLNRNKERDKQNIAKLHELGWDVLVIWECETRDEATLSRRISQFLDDETIA
jgi:DNA mismatch endonuclease (patch repair protein)